MNSPSVPVTGGLLNQRVVIQILALAGITFLSFVLMTGLANPVLSESPVESITGIQEIPYYLKKLEETTLEDKRVEYDKIIHDAVVNADLSNKRIVKELAPLIEQIRIATDSGFDRTNLSGQAMWLNSAIDYYEFHKGRPVVNIPESDWSPAQLQSADGSKLSTYPDKILLHSPGGTITLVEHSHIHEAIISPHGQKVAFFRTIRKEGGEAEVWVVHVKKKKSKRITTMPSCLTLLFSLNGKQLYLQERPSAETPESAIYVISAKGGKKRKIGTGRVLETLVSKGKYANNLIVYKSTLHPLGATQDCPFAFSPKGVELGRIYRASCR